MVTIETDKIIDNVKVDLGIEDTLQDDLLEALTNKVTSHFQLAYGVDSVDEVFGFIIEDCVIKRFNRRGSEGAKSESVEGHSVTYYDTNNEFEAYDSLIKSKLSLVKSKERKGGIYIL